VGISVAGGVQALENIEPAALRDVGLNSVFVSCYEDEVRWYADDIGSFLRRSHRVGLECYVVPWGYGKFLDPDPSIESLYIDTHPETLQRDSRGRRCRKACPNNPRYLEWFASSMRTLAWLTECEGFLWDEPSFHVSRGAWGCRCVHCKRLYWAKAGVEMPRALTDPVCAFRRESVAMFLLAAAAAIEAVDRRLVSFVMPTPSLGPSEVQTGAEDWRTLARCSAVDGLSIWVPWQARGAQMEGTLVDLFEGARKKGLGEGKQVVLWVVGSPQPKDRLLDTIMCAHLAGCEHLVISDYESLFRTSAFAPFAASLSRTLARVQ
jgi:hypothetical protein